MVSATSQGFIVNTVSTTVPLDSCLLSSAIFWISKWLPVRAAVLTYSKCSPWTHRRRFPSPRDSEVEVTALVLANTRRWRERAAPRAALPIPCQSGFTSSSH